MYTVHFPDLISTIVRLKNSNKISPANSKIVEDLNQKLLKTVILICKTKEEYESIFKRLKEEFRQESRNTSQTQEAIIQWYTMMFQTYSETLFDTHQDIFDQLIENLNFDNSSLVKRIMYLVCMLSTKSEKYSRKVMEQLIERFYSIRS
jgi:hypothetical protein